MFIQKRYNYIKINIYTFFSILLQDFGMTVHGMIIRSECLTNTNHRIMIKFQILTNLTSYKKRCLGIFILKVQIKFVTEFFGFYQKTSQKLIFLMFHFNFF